MDVTLFKKSVIYMALFAILIMIMTNFSYGNEFPAGSANEINQLMLADEAIEDTEIDPTIIESDEDKNILDEEVSDL